MPSLRFHARLAARRFPLAVTGIALTGLMALLGIGLSAPHAAVPPAANAAAAASVAPAAAPVTITASGLAIAPVRELAQAGMVSLDGSVEAVRQTVLAAQVSGAIVALQVRAGDMVKSGQVLVRIEAQAAQQAVTAGSAQADAARAQLQVATRELERQKQLFAQRFISQAALDAAQGQFESARAQHEALLAQIQVAQTQTGFFVIRAPYDAVVGEVPVALGDMVTPGRPLVALHDPAALRITAALPQSLFGNVGDGRAVRFEVPGKTTGPQAAVGAQVLPTLDPVTRTGQLRLTLAGGGKGLAPGMFARVWLPAPGAAAPRLMVPATAVLRQAELTALYVIDGQGQPRLRQVRLGPTAGGEVEVLSGIAAGEQVVLDPQAAVRKR